MCAQILGFSRAIGLGLGLALGSVWFNWFVLVLWTIMWRHLLSAESMFVRMENSEIQRLISVKRWISLAKFSCKFRSVRTENSELLLTVDFRPYGQKIAKFNCKLNSVHMCNFRPHGRKIANSYTWFLSVWTDNNTNRHYFHYIVYIKAYWMHSWPSGKGASVNWPLPETLWIFCLEMAYSVTGKSLIPLR